MANEYATLAEAKDWCGATAAEHEVKLQNVVTSVSRWIDRDTDRHFWLTAANTDRFFDTCDPCSLDLCEDLVVLAAVATDDDRDGTYGTVWSASDYQPTPVGAPTGAEPRPYRAINAVAGRRFPYRTTAREGLIRVTGTWGWPAVPDMVKQACLIQTNRIFRRKDAPEGLMAFADFGVVRMQGRLDPDVAAMIAPYELTRLLVA